MRKLACVILILCMLFSIVPISAADAAADLPDLIITKIISTTKSISGRSWPFNGTRDGFEAIEIVNTSGKELDLYAYGLCYNDSDSGIIKAVTPIKGGDFLDGSTWSLKDLFDGDGNPKECKLAPNEVAVLWLINGDTTNYLKSGRIIKVSEFRNFYGIDAQTKVIAVDGNASASCGDAGNFSMKNSMHNVIGIYRLDTQVRPGETAIESAAESWAIRCTNASHSGEKGCGIAAGKNMAMLYVPVSGEKMVDPYAPNGTTNYAEFAPGEYTLGVLTADQKKAVDAFIAQSGASAEEKNDSSDQQGETGESAEQPDAPATNFEMPNVIITKVVGTNARVEGEPWNYSSTPADAYEAIEVINTSGRNLDLFAYGLCYENGETGIIRAVTPIKAALIQDDTTWRWTGMPVNPATCILRPQETAVIWLVNQNSIDSTIADFRNFHNIPAETRIVAVDGHNDSANGGNTNGNFNIKNSAHNILGIYQLSAKPVVGVSKFADAAESWVVRCGAHTSEEGYYPMNASTRSYAVSYVPVKGKKQLAVSEEGNLAYGSYTLGTLTAEQRKAVEAVLTSAPSEDSGKEA